MSLIDSILTEVLEVQSKTLSEYALTPEFLCLKRMILTEAGLGRSSIILPTIPKKSRELLLLAGFKVKDFPAFTEQISWSK